MASIGERIIQAVNALPGVEQLPHRFNGVEFRIHGREIGHIHGSRMADLPFPVKVRKQLVEEGRASLHHLLPETGWVSYYIKGEADIERVVDLFRLNYEIITARRSNRGKDAAADAGADDAAADDAGAGDAG